MINFNEKDDNMLIIARLSKLANLETKNDFRIYGLSNEGNWPILISAQENIVSGEQEKQMADFMKINGIESATEDVKPDCTKIYIGLRRDVREHPELCALLLETFVHFIEGRLELQPDFKVGNIPSFKTNAEKIEKKQ